MTNAQREKLAFLEKFQRFAYLHDARGYAYAKLKLYADGSGVVYTGDDALESPEQLRFAEFSSFAEGIVSLDHLLAHEAEAQEGTC